MKEADSSPKKNRKKGSIGCCGNDALIRLVYLASGARVKW